MKPEIQIILCLFLGFVFLEIVLTRFFRKPGQVRGDGWVELVTSAALLVVTQPLVFAAGFGAAALLWPEGADVLESWPFLAVFALFLVFDDMTQYWWHRTAHAVPWLYKLHRPHHEAGYMSVRLVWRNNVFYYLLMPGLWFSGALVFLGGGWVYAVYIVIKMAVIFGAHSDVRWDAPLYRLSARARWLRPLVWVIERTISTPATHSAHHGKHAHDGVTHYKGNYGNLLFFWDVLFGTAKITRRYPEAFGVENLPDTTAAEQMFWPVVRHRAAARATSASRATSAAHAMPNGNTPA